MGSEYTWGDAVGVNDSAPDAYGPGQIGEVVVVFAVDSEVKVSKRNTVIGTRLPLVEFSDGAAFEVPAAMVEPVTYDV